MNGRLEAPFSSPVRPCQGPQLLHPFAIIMLPLPAGPGNSSPAKGAVNPQVSGPHGGELEVVVAGSQGAVYACPNLVVIREDLCLG